MYQMPKKKQLDQNAIPTTSLADMMFLLLIFFIMTTTLTRVTGIVSVAPLAIVRLDSPRQMANGPASRPGDIAGECRAGAGAAPRARTTDAPGDS